MTTGAATHSQLSSLDPCSATTSATPYALSHVALNTAQRNAPFSQGVLLLVCQALSNATHTYTGYTCTAQHCAQIGEVRRSFVAQNVMCHSLSQPHVGTLHALPLLGLHSAQYTCRAQLENDSGKTTILTQTMLTGVYLNMFWLVCSLDQTKRLQSIFKADCRINKIAACWSCWSRIDWMDVFLQQKTSALLLFAKMLQTLSQVS